MIRTVALHEAVRRALRDGNPRLLAPAAADEPDLPAAEARIMATPKEIAEWMIAQLEEGDSLTQVDAIAEIENLFGTDYLYVSDVGEKSIDRRVLYQFRKLTADDVVWVTRHGGGFWSGAHWRKRGTGDAPGRTQYEY